MASCIKHTAANDTDTTVKECQASKKRKQNRHYHATGAFIRQKFKLHSQVGTEKIYDDALRCDEISPKNKRKKTMKQLKFLMITTNKVLSL